MPERSDRLEREVAAAFTEVLAPQPGDPAKLAAMIELALRPGGAPPSGGAAPAKVGPWLVGASGFVVAAVALLVTGREPTPPSAAVIDDVVAAPAPAILPQPLEDDGWRVTPDRDDVTPVRPVADPGWVAPSAPPASGVRSTARPGKRRQGGSPPPSTPEAPAALADPDALLRAANQARRAREFAEADRLYTDLQERFPGSRAARTSRVPHARLLLDTLDRPAEALDIFSAYLDVDPRGTLSEEALVGRAQALRRLGRDADARDAWHSLLARFPESVYAPTAERQIAEVRP